MAANMLVMNEVNAMNQHNIEKDELLDRCKYLGIPLNTYTNWLLHARRPTMDAIISICTKLGESSDWLLGLTDCRREILEHQDECTESEWMRRAITAERKLEKVNAALSHALRGFEELQEAVK